MSSNAQPPAPAMPRWATIGLALALVLAVWALMSARSANATATENEAARTVADLDLTLVPGGPERFSSSFEAAVEDGDADDLDADARDWLTIIVRNTGDAEAQDVALDADVLAPDGTRSIGEMATFEDLEASVTDGLLQLELGDVGADERATVFVGFAADALPGDVAEAWFAEHARAVRAITARADGDDETLAAVYGHAAP